MCGILGEWADSPIDREQFRRMRETLEHRGPNGAGEYLNDDGTLAFGHRRLSIIDLTEAGNQPMPNEDGTVWLVFNGEIYNYLELRPELEQRGHEFMSDTDSEVIIHGYEEWGVDCLDRLRGMFAFGIWDETEGRLFLARDRLGIKPLYYYDGDDRFVFASETKAIASDPRFDRQISDSALRHYLTYRYVPAPETIWEDVYKLPPGSALIHDSEDFEVTPYWRPADSLADEQVDDETAIETLREELEYVVDIHLNSDVPVSVLLSGGVDSSTIAALASQQSESLDAFSLDFETDERSEIEHAKAAAEACNLELHTDTHNSASLEEVLDDVLYHYDEPLADTSVFPTMQLMGQVSDHTKVALSGDGGDEVFGGYRWYGVYRAFSRLDPLTRVAGSAQPVMAAVDDRVDHPLVRKLTKALDIAGSSDLERYRKIMYPPFEPEVLNALVGEDGDWTDRVADYAGDGLSSMKDLQFLDLNTFMIDDILVKVDRASMAHSLEVRVPLLDHRIIEYTLGLDDSTIYDGGEKKHLLKSVAREVLPDSIIDRRKEGFGARVDENGFLDTYTDVLEDSRAAEDGILDQDTLTELLAEDIDDRKTFRLVMFELWYRTWAIGEPGETPV